MSINLPPSAAINVPYEDDSLKPPHSDGSSQGSDEESDNAELEGYDDWVEEERPCKSLFEDKTLPSAQKAVEYDRQNHNFDLHEISSRLGLDFHQRTRLVNYIRSQNAPSPSSQNLNGKEPFFADDTYLLPAVEDDPLLQLQTDDWSDSEVEETIQQGSAEQGTSLTNAASKVKRLQVQLKQAREDITNLQQLFKAKLDLLDDVPTEAPKKDDDTHYFDSYAYNDIHQTMIQDTIRTSSYARFILSNPLIFKDAVVMDVGCGTGILSLFAAKAGARKVFAIDASGIAVKAKQIVEDNGWEDVITVLQTKVEDLASLPEGYKHVDVIISEWMGYCCIYESMLDSVLVARDRFLRKPSEGPNSSAVFTSSPKLGVIGLPQDHTSAISVSPSQSGSLLPAAGIDFEKTNQGLMAPSQCRMMIGLTDATDLIRERIKFWDDIYGFKLSAMANEIYEDAVVDIIRPEAMLGDAAIIKDIPLQHISARALDFVSPFSLNVSHSGEINAFVVYFDTFFTVNGKDVPLDAEVEIHKDGFVQGDIMRIGSSGDALSRRQSWDAKDLREGLAAAHSSPARIDENTALVEVEPPTPLAPPPPPPPPPPAPAYASPSSSGVPIPPSPLKRPSMGAGRRSSRRNSTGMGLPRPVSFSTGPLSSPTHWKQTVFLLRSPVKARKGTTVTGSFHCRKSPLNSRELDVEIHYLVQHPSFLPAGAQASAAATNTNPIETVVQMFKVR